MRSFGSTRNLFEDLLAPDPLQGIALQVQVLVFGGDPGVADQHAWFVQLDRMSDNRFPDIFPGQKTGRERGISIPRQPYPANGRTLLANSPDWLKAAPMRENLLASWRQPGQKQDPCPSLLNHNAKYKRLLPPCCDFANGVQSFTHTPFCLFGLSKTEPEAVLNKGRGPAS